MNTIPSEREGFAVAGCGISNSAKGACNCTNSGELSTCNNIGVNGDTRNGELHPTTVCTGFVDNTFKVRVRSNGRWIAELKRDSNGTAVNLDIADLKATTKVRSLDSAGIKVAWECHSFRNGQSCCELELKIAQRNGVVVGIRIGTLDVVHLLLDRGSKN